MVTFDGWGWREKQKDNLQKQSPGRVLQERSSDIFGKTYRKAHVQDVRLQLYLKRGSSIEAFFLWNF